MHGCVEVSQATGTVLLDTATVLRARATVLQVFERRVARIADRLRPSVLPRMCTALVERRHAHVLRGAVSVDPERVRLPHRCVEISQPPATILRPCETVWRGLASSQQDRNERKTARTSARTRGPIVA